MAQNSKIEWTHHTANLWHGCTKVHAGCDNCYAETLSHRWGRDIWGPDKPRMDIKSVLGDLLKYQRAAQAAGEIHRVFVGSMMDIFEKPMPLVDKDGNALHHDTGAVRNLFFENITYEFYPNLLFLFLTKRPSNINKYIPESWKVSPPKNVMFGCSVSDQKTADDLIPPLLQVNGRHFLSCEPLLGNINLAPYLWRPSHVAGPSDFERLPGIDWVIAGGESGHNARPMHPDWVRSLRDQCKEAGVPFFFKQWGEWCYVDQMPDDTYMRIDMNGLHEEIYKVGKKAADRLLDGKLHDEIPEI
jgi:protein gp37